VEIDLQVDIAAPHSDGSTVDPGLISGRRLIEQGTPGTELVVDPVEAQP
jgi:hypothetical protein